MSIFFSTSTGSLAEKIIFGIPELCARKSAPLTEEDPILKTSTNSSFFLFPKKIPI